MRRALSHMGSAPSSSALTQARYDEAGRDGEGRLRVGCLLGGETMAVASGADFKVSQ